MSEVTNNLLARINKSIAKMESDGYDGVGYHNLVAKRSAILAGAEVKVKNVTEEIIGEVGSLISNVSRDLKLGGFNMDAGV
jgi:hypothetical protein